MILLVGWRAINCTSFCGLQRVISICVKAVASSIFRNFHAKEVTRTRFSIPDTPRDRIHIPPNMLRYVVTCIHVGYVCICQKGASDCFECQINMSPVLLCMVRLVPLTYWRKIISFEGAYISRSIKNKD